MRILVTGSRGWKHRDIVWETLEQYEAVEVICGYNPQTRYPPGVDEYAYEWTLMAFRPVAECWAAKWDVFGKVAGFVRNHLMVLHSRPDVALAFIRDGSPGATDCATRAYAAGIPLRVFRESETGEYLGEDKGVADTIGKLGPPRHIRVPASVGNGEGEA